MKDKGLPKHILSNIDTIDPKYKGFVPMRKLMWEYWNIGNIPFYDSCCPEKSNSPLPVGFSIDEDSLQRYDPTIKDWINIASGGGGSPLTVSNFEGQIPSVTEIYVGNNLILSDNGSGVVTIDAFPPDNTPDGLQEVTDEGNTTTNDIEITDFTKGVILRSPNDSRWRITVDNFGVLTTTLVP